MAKADAIQEKLKLNGDPSLENVLLITCDQVVVHNGNILEKPTSKDEARQFIEGYKDFPASTVGSICVTQPGTGRQESEVDTAHIHFDAIPPETIDYLIAEGEVFYCAGGLMVEHDKVNPHVTKIEGTMDAVMGLPKARVLNLLAKFFD